MAGQRECITCGNTLFRDKAYLPIYPNTYAVCATLTLQQTPAEKTERVVNRAQDIGINVGNIWHARGMNEQQKCEVCCAYVHVMCDIFITIE
jgi:hypothetical protein